MARISVTRTFEVAATPAKCIREIRQRLESQGVGIRHGIDQEIECSAGASYLTRLIGGWLGTEPQLPIWVRVYCSEHQGWTSAQVVLEEAMGRACLGTSFEREYEKRFGILMDSLARAAG
jgi:hypothetical protein